MPIPVPLLWNLANVDMNGRVILDSVLFQSGGEVCKLSAVVNESYTSPLREFCAEVSPEDGKKPRKEDSW